MADEKKQEEVVIIDNTHKPEKDPLLLVTSVWDKYKKKLGIAVGAAAVVIGGWWAYQNFIVKPNEEKAANALYKVQELFAKDSSRKVIDGTGEIKGALYIIKTFSGTKQANLAHFYAGVSYLKLGEFQKAVDHLKDFSTDSKQTQAAAYCALADAYSELKKNDEALDYYKKAASHFEQDEASSAEYLFKAALFSEVLGKNKEALELFKLLKEKFPTTEKGRNADKYIYRLNEEKNDLSVN